MSCNQSLNFRLIAVNYSWNTSHRGEGSVSKSTKVKGLSKYSHEFHRKKKLRSKSAVCPDLVAPGNSP